LTQQVTTIINQLHGYFDEIGVPSHERDSRESEVGHLEERNNPGLGLILGIALCSIVGNTSQPTETSRIVCLDSTRQLVPILRQNVVKSTSSQSRRDNSSKSFDNWKHLLTTRKRVMTTTRKTENSRSHIHCCNASSISEANIKQSASYTANAMSKSRVRYTKSFVVAILTTSSELAEALHSYASHLESSFLQIKLPPTSPNAKISPTFDLSPTYVSALDAEFTRIYEEYNKRVVTVQSYAEEIVMLWSELGTPQAQIDSVITKCYRESPEQLGLHQDDLTRLKSKRDKLMEEKRARERRLKELKATVESLWEKLSVDQPDRRAFLAANRGCGMRTINEFEDELARLEEMKRQNLHIFVEDARFKLQSLWDSLYFAEEEMLDFTPAFSGESREEFTDLVQAANYSRRLLGRFALST